MKKVLCLLLVFALGSMLIGCTAEETELWNAYKKTADYNSCTMSMTMKLSADASSVSNPEIAQALKLINGASFDISGKMMADKDKGQTKAYFDYIMNYMGMSMKFKLWLDADSSANKFVEIFEMPEIMKLSMAEMKQYYYIDLSDSLSEMGLSTDILNPAVSKQLLESLEKMDTTGIKIEKKDGLYDVTIPGQSLMSLLKQYFEMLMSNPAFSAMNTEEAKGEINDAFEKLSKIDILDGKDIVVSMSINSQGYIEDFNTSLNFVIDPAQISEAFGESYSGASTDKMSFGLDLKCKYSDYDTVTSIDIPTLTEENSANIMDLNTVSTNERIFVVVNGSPVAFDVPPQSVNDRTMVPICCLIL